MKHLKFKVLKFKFECWKIEKILRKLNKYFHKPLSLPKTLSVETTFTRHSLKWNESSSSWWIVWVLETWLQGMLGRSRP